jgi:hypothetical protein
MEEKICEVIKKLSFLDKELLIEIIRNIKDNNNFNVEEFVCNKMGDNINPILKTFLYLSFLKEEKGTDDLKDFILFKNKEGETVMYLDTYRKQFIGNDLHVDFNKIYEPILGDKFLVLHETMQSGTELSIKSSINSLRRIIDKYPMFNQKGSREVTSFILEDVELMVELNKNEQDNSITNRTKTLRKNKILKKIYKDRHPLDIEWMYIDTINKKIDGFWSPIKNFKLISIDNKDGWSLYEKMNKTTEAIPYLDEIRLLFV